MITNNDAFTRVEKMQTGYTDINSKTIDNWVDSGWEWGKPIGHDAFTNAKKGEWSVLLTPTKPVPKEWFGSLAGKEVLGLASGGGQQIPVFSALGASCTVLDYSDKQLESEKIVSEREGYKVRIVKADMTKRLPFGDGEFDVVFHPVSNCYIKDVFHVWNECYRILRKGGVLLAGLDNGLNFAFNEEETSLGRPLPFDPTADKALYAESIEKDWGIQFSHTIEEQVAGQLKAGFTLTDIYEDTNGEGNLHAHNIPTFYATRSVK